jgi:chitin disaccharide deacetylase
MTNKRLIVNADDFGRTSGINRGIVDAHRRGIVTSATLMVAYEPAAEAMALARENPALGVGLHLAFTGGPPVLPPERLPSLVDSAGRLPPKPEGLGLARASEILAEARAQLARFREIAKADPTHFDSHHHSHRTPAVLEAVLTLAWETGLPVRSASADMHQRLKRENVPTTDAFIEEFYDQQVLLETLLAIVDGIGPGTSELMCHPAVVDDELRRSSGYADMRTRELELLTHREVRQAIQAMGIKLIHFGELRVA